MKDYCKATHSNRDTQNMLKMFFDNSKFLRIGCGLTLEDLDFDFLLSFLTGFSDFVAHYLLKPPRIYWPTLYAMHKFNLEF
jgi:hypothetical protein